MKFSTIKLTLALCYWMQIFLPLSCAAECGEEWDKRLQVVERGEIQIEKPTHVSIYNKDGTHYILVSSVLCCVYALSAKFVDDSSAPILLKDGLENPGEVRQAPDGAFKFPAVVFTDKFVKDLNSRVFAIDITDINNPKSYIISSKSTGKTGYSDILFRNEKEFFVGETYEAWNHHLKLYRSDDDDETGQWIFTKLGKVNIAGMVIYRNISKAFDAIFAYDSSNLKVIWSENEYGLPGDWMNTNHCKVATIDKASVYTGIQLEDVNEDGWPELLLTVSSIEGEVWAYEVANPGGFREAGGYRLHKLATNLKGKSIKCPEVARTFIPVAGYEGKPWILVTGFRCTIAYYLVPESNIAKNWNYRVYKISEKPLRQGSMVALDFDKDGFMDLFTSLYDDNLVRVYSFVDPNKTDAESGSTSNYVTLSHVILHVTCIVYVVASL